MRSVKTVMPIFFVSLAFFCMQPLMAGQTRKESAPPGENYRTVTRNGAWCWFSDPRAVVYEGAKKAAYIGWVNGFGDIVVASLDYATMKMDTAVLHAKLEADDHANPSILVRRDGRILVFYSKHSQKDGPLIMRMSTRPEDVTEWLPEKTLAKLNDNPAYPADVRRDFCYSNPVQLSAENNRIFLFWRGIDFKPCFSTSADGGETWEEGRILIMPENLYKDRRPYVKIGSRGSDRIHIAFTDGHPRNEPGNGIHYMCYKNGAFYRADGTRIADIASLPVEPGRTDLVYDAGKTKVRAWIWDVAEDDKGNPVIVYARLPFENDHRYHYAVWDGKRWLDHEIVSAGPWFPKTPAGEREREPHYSGGIVLDHADPSIVYLSRLVDGVFEIEKWTTRDRGRTWKTESVTSGSTQDNVRPFVIRSCPVQTENHPAKAGQVPAKAGQVPAKADLGPLKEGLSPRQAEPSLLWMNNHCYAHYTDFDASIRMDIPIMPLSHALEPDAVKQAMRRVADWQLANPSRHPGTDWTHGALFTGLTAWALMADDSVYLKACTGFAEQNAWKLGDRIYHADDHCVGAMYLELSGLDRKPDRIRPLRDRFDFILSHPSSASLKKDDQRGQDRWWWCDALFMGPPVWTKLAAMTGDRRYLDFMNQEWWATTGYLYDKEECLYFRDDDYFGRREANGKKVFWSRGNGWVMAGLARVIQNLPLNFPDRPRYVRLFKEMAAKLVSIQPKDGLWRPSLLDPDSYPNPETSGSGFYCYALAWGLNNGLLDSRTYKPAVEKAWAGLVRSVHMIGKLGYVQPIGADPKHVNADQTEVYGTGAFLLAGSEVYKIALFGDAQKTPVIVSNPATVFRNSETVELGYAAMNKLLPSLTRTDATVFDAKRNRFLVTQMMGDVLLFQADWTPNENKTFWVSQERKEFQIPGFTNRTFATFVPQRKDDFAWENDRVHFRMYGEGLDFFKVGLNRGCGGASVWKDGKLWGSGNFRRWRILANGPLRVVFELEYDTWDAGGIAVSEVKRISLDLGSNLNRFENRYTTTEKKLDVAIGLVKVSAGGDMTYNLAESWMGYWQPSDSINGAIGCGVVFASAPGYKFADHDNHGLFMVPMETDKPLVYYAGAGWSKYAFPDRDAWTDYLKQFAKRISNPLKLNITE